MGATAFPIILKMYCRCGFSWDELQNEALLSRIGQQNKCPRCRSIGLTKEQFLSTKEINR